MQICGILSTVCRFSCLGSCLLCQRSGFWWFFLLFITWFLVILAKLLWNQSVQNIPNCQFRRPWERYSHKSVIDVKCHSVILSFPFWNTILLKELTYIWAESFAIKHSARVTPSTTNFAIFCLLQCRNTLYTNRYQNDLKSNEILQPPSGCTPTYHQHSNESCEMTTEQQHAASLSYGTSPDRFCRLSCCRLSHRWLRRNLLWFFSVIRIHVFIILAKLLQNPMHPKNCLFRTPREELVYRIQFPIPKQQHFLDLSPRHCKTLRSCVAIWTQQLW